MMSALGLTYMKARTMNLTSLKRRKARRSRRPRSIKIKTLSLRANESAACFFGLLVNFQQRPNRILSSLCLPVNSGPAEVENFE